MSVSIRNRRKCPLVVCAISPPSLYGVARLARSASALHFSHRIVCNPRVQAKAGLSAGLHMNASHPLEASWDSCRSQRTSQLQQAKLKLRPIPPLHRDNVGKRRKDDLNIITLCYLYYIGVMIMATVHSVILLFVSTAGLQGRSQACGSLTTTNQCGQDEAGGDRAPSGA